MSYLRSARRGASIIPLIRSTISIVLALLVMMTHRPPEARADGTVQGTIADARRAAPGPGSDASFDKRLPPVYPGEQVNDSGKTLRVWSSSGPVPVSDAPAAPRPGAIGLQQPPEGLAGVIVDARPSPRAALVPQALPNADFSGPE